MSKELTPLGALKRIGKVDLYSEREDYCYLKNVYVNEYNLIEKSLKALEIIKGFRKDKYSKIEIDGNDIIMNVYLTLDDDKIDLLKEVLL